MSMAKDLAAGEWERVGAAAELVAKVLRWLFPVMLLAVLFNLLRWKEFGGGWSSLIQNASIAAMYVFLLARKRFSPFLWLAVLCTGVLMYGLIGLARWGIHGQGITVCLLASILASTLGWRSWCFFTGFSLVACALVGAGHVFRVLPTGFDPGTFTHSSAAWLVCLTSFAVAAFSAMLLNESSRELLAASVALRDREERLLLALDGAALASWDWDLTTGGAKFSGRYADMLGYESGEELSRINSWYRLVHPDDWPRVRSAWKAHYDGETEFYEAEHRLRHKSDRWVWVLNKGKIVERDASGTPVRACGTYLDITNRRHYEEALLLSERNYREIFNATGDTIIVMDPYTGAITDFNDTLVATLGYTREEASRLSTADMSSTDPEFSQEVARAHVRKALREGSDTVEWKARRKDGSEFWIEVTLRSAEIGGVRRLLGVIRDISVRKDLEEQLRHAHRMEVVGQLAGGIAHDFNNLLQIICGFTEMALGGIESAHRVRPFLQNVANAGERAARLVGQLLAFSRRQTLRLEVLTLDEMVRASMKALAPVLGGRIEVRLLPGTDNPRVRADRVQMEQVLLNLCVNARDAMPENGVLSVQTGMAVLNEDYCALHAWASPGRYATLIVTDTGHGMDEATLARIWEPFFTTKGVGQGTGLGLPSVYGITRQLGGGIDVESAPGRGSRFTVYLPEHVPSGAEDRASGGVLEDVAGGGDETILIAEDEAIVAGYCKKTLEKQGYTVIVADNGEEAVRLCEERGGAVDLAVLDVVMPRLGGQGAYQRLKSQYPNMRFLFASGHSEHALDPELLERDHLTLLHKPFFSKDLLLAVRRTLDA